MEEELGITEYTTSTTGFTGILKQKYTDFIVREVTVEDEVLSLQSVDGSGVESLLTAGNVEEAIPVQNEEVDTGSAASIVAALKHQYNMGVPIAQEAALLQFTQAFVDKVTEGVDSWVGFPSNDKAVRSSIHQQIRQLFGGQVESVGELVDGVWNIKLVSKVGNVKESRALEKRRQTFTWPTDRLGDYLRFTLLKENVDTMTAINNISKQMRMKATSFAFNGTKDKRAVTIQHVTVFRKKPSDFNRLNNYFGSPFLRFGDFQYVHEPCKLGRLGGNAFEIILRDVKEPIEAIQQACQALTAKGFINYFGLQRFGRGTGSTHVVGVHILRSDWRACIETYFRPDSQARTDVVEGKKLFAEQKYAEAARVLPHSMFTEKQILQHLAKLPNDYCGALGTVSKSLRLLCVHAYQSSVWNKAVSERIRQFGLVVVPGDLVRVTSASTKVAVDVAAVSSTEAQPSAEQENNIDNTDAEAEIVEEEEAVDSSEVHVVTAEDVSAGRFSVYDIVLPIVGSDSILPQHSIGDYIRHLLEVDGLSMESFGTCNIIYRARGTYRHILQQAKNFSFAILKYSDPHEELAVTEISKFRAMNNRKRKFEGESTAESATGAMDEETAQTDKKEANLVALQLKFTLPPGTYATMLLRELTKQSTEVSYHAQMTSDHLKN